ncbi:tripartite motif-containing protein 40-like [Teleopsis dalmanni]|uniref:tripartite motif-containing protein 40-like n=1 Tax=Teleopsis dalmanni TaxID=139649 RepID=UPI000D32B0A4|nr:tripartite motif-containing protein 40-like [Teleopsis dalmanni]
MDESEKFCVICQYSIVDLVKLSCRHVFCKKCIKDYVNYANTRNTTKRCPLCRKKFMETVAGYITIEKLDGTSSESDTDIEEC